jgi:hypothetical protein
MKEEDTNHFLFGVLWIFLGVLIMISGIFLPDINTCNGWCCARSAANKSGVLELKTSEPIPFQPQESKVSLNQYAREQGNGKGGAVLVLENFFSGLATLNISHQPIYNIAKIAAEVRSNNSENNVTYTYIHKNKFPLIAISGKKGTAQEIYMAAYMGQALAREKDSVLIINGMTAYSPALEAWTRLVDEGLIHWQTTDLFHNETEDWAKGTYAKIDSNKSSSQILCEILSGYLNLDESKVQYYSISKEREEELRKAYATDKKFMVNNITTVFHAAVLKVIYPTLNITVSELVSDIVEDQELYPKAVEFLEKYILV